MARKGSYIYVFKEGTRFKIGRSKDPFARAKKLQTGNSIKIEVVMFGWVGDASSVEADIHDIIVGSRRRGEFFDLEPSQLQWLRWKLHGPNSYGTEPRPTTTTPLPPAPTEDTRPLEQLSLFVLEEPHRS